MKNDQFSQQEAPAPETCVERLEGLLLAATNPEWKQHDTFLYPSFPRISQDSITGLPRYEETQLDWAMLRALGRSPRIGRQSDEKESEQDRTARRQAASLLVAGDKAFSLACIGNGNQPVSILCGMQDDPQIDRRKAILGAAFGSVDAMPTHALGSPAITWQARCQPIKLDVEFLNKMEQSGKDVRWMDMAVSVLVGTTCTLGLFFTPAKYEWMGTSLQGARTALTSLNDYQRHQVQLSANYGENSSGGTNRNGLLGIAGGISGKSRSDNHGDSAGFTIFRTLACSDSQVESLESQLKYRIRLLEQAKQKGWFLRITVGATKEDDSDAESLRNILAAALMHMGWDCTWERVPDASDKTECMASVVLPAYIARELADFPSRDFPGFRREPCEVLNLNPPKSDKIDSDIPLGSICWNGIDTRIPLRIPRTELNRHMFVCGMTGSGKSNSVCSLLSSLDDLPFLVIEPVKGEYHALPNVHRYTMQAGSTNGLRMNPFWFPEGSSLSYHIDSLKAIITSAFDLYAAMPNILEQCLYRVYMNCGWDFVSGHNIYLGELPDEYLYPTFRTLCNEIERYLDESAFEGETRGNYQGALLSRLQSFTTGAKGALLNTVEHISFDQWASENIVVELEALADDADKAIVMGALLVQYFQYIKFHFTHKATNKLRHIFVLEEAHHLFRETSSQQGEGGTNASNQLINMLNNLLAECRAYQESFIIVDQSPSAISPSVLKNTGVKLVHRVDYGEDIRLLQSVLLLDENSRITASLERGSALVRFGSMDIPAQIKIPLCEDKENCTLGQSVDALAVRGNSLDRILSNQNLLRVLSDEARRFLNVILFSTEISSAREALEQFETAMYRMVVYSCGWDSVASLSMEDYCLPLLDICIVSAAEGAYPRQFCLVGMIRMYVRRLAQLLSRVHGMDLQDSEWTLLEDYRVNRLYPRLLLFYRNNPDLTIQNLLSVLGEYPDLGIIQLIVNSLWDVSAENRESALRKLMPDLFSLPEPELEARYLELTQIYIQQAVKE